MLPELQLLTFLVSGSMQFSGPDAAATNARARGIDHVAISQGVAYVLILLSLLSNLSGESQLHLMFFSQLFFILYCGINNIPTNQSSFRNTFILSNSSFNIHEVECSIILQHCYKHQRNHIQQRQSTRDAKMSTSHQVIKNLVLNAVKSLQRITCWNCRANKAT